MYVYTYMTLHNYFNINLSSNNIFCYILCSLFYTYISKLTSEILRLFFFCFFIYFTLRCNLYVLYNSSRTFSFWFDEQRFYVGVDVKCAYLRNCSSYIILNGLQIILSMKMKYRTPKQIFKKISTHILEICERKTGFKIQIWP